MDTPRPVRPLRIAMIGQKGLPATYGGVEHHVEELGARLAARGHQVEVFCRPSYGTALDQTYRGMHLRPAATTGTKHLDAIEHSVVSSVHCLGRAPDVVHYHALGPVLAAPLVRAFSDSAVVVTVHGLDHQRDKWGPLARQVLTLGHWMSTRVPDEIVVVSRDLEQHYASRSRLRCSYIPNGVTRPTTRPAREIARRWGLEPNGYVLFVGRLVPEKAPDLLLRAYRAVPTELPLVVVGDSSFTDDYVAALHDAARTDPRDRLCGYVYGETLGELYSNAAVFVQPSRLEGLPLTLLEAASHAIPIVATDIPPHREILGGEGLVPVGDAGALAHRLARVLTSPDHRTAAVVRDRVLQSFSWDDAARALEQVYLRVTGPRPRRPGVVRDATVAS